MKAEIVLMNPTRGMIAARSDEVGFVIFELLGDYSPEIGDVVSHSDFTSLGSEKYRNVTQREDMDVYVQNIVGTIDAAKEQCFLQ
jgi:hypothetical protein